MSSISSVAPYVPPSAASKTATPAKALGANEPTNTGTAASPAAATSPSTIVSVSPEAMAKSHEASAADATTGSAGPSKLGEIKQGVENAASSTAKHISNGVTATKNYLSEAV